MKNTYVVNLIGGPCCGKTTMCALLFAQLKLRGYIIEYVQEYAKHLVWTKDYDTLNNQYHVTRTQYRLFKQINGNVDIIITDGTLLHGLYYNQYNPNNTSNVDKTEELIINCYNEFKNINIFLDRGSFKYEQEGRIETEEQSLKIDVILKELLNKFNIPYTIFKSSVSEIDNMIEFIENNLEKN
jgi:hypothetical protein